MKNGVLQFKPKLNTPRLSSIIFNTSKWKRQRKDGLRDWEQKLERGFFRNNTQHTLCTRQQHGGQTMQTNIRRKIIESRKEALWMEDEDENDIKKWDRKNDKMWEDII